MIYFRNMFNLPNLLTLTNVVCGCMAIKSWFDGFYETAAMLVIIALIADFLDGFVARKLKINGDFGKQLDSLADMITFGVFPGVVVWSLLDGSGWEWVALIVPAFSALRLAKFNIDTRQTDSFLGLATPANGLFWLGWGMAVMPGELSGPVFTAMEQIGVVIGAVVVFSLLLISEIPMLAFKFKNFTFADNKPRYIFLVLASIAGASSIFLGWSLFTLSIVILLYLIFSVVNNLLHKAA